MKRDAGDESKASISKVQQQLTTVGCDVLWSTGRHIDQERDDCETANPRSGDEPCQRCVAHTRSVSFIRCDLAGRLLARFQHEDGEKHIVSNKAAAASRRSIRRRNKEERWNRDVLLGILENPGSLQDGRVEVDHIPAAPARTIPMVNPEVEAGPTTGEIQERGERQTILHHEEDGV